MGHDLESFPTDTKQQCELACHNRDACNGFSYLVNQKKCFLKTEVKDGHPDPPELNPSDETESAVACGINACTKWGWSFFDDQNIMGHDVKLELADSANHCQKYCLSRDDCNAYSYIASDRKCWLKNDVDYIPETNPAVGVKSGVKCGTKKCTKWGYNFWDNNNIMGHDLYTVQADDVPLCQTHCRNDDRCNGYSLSGTTCYLKTGVEAFPAVNDGPGMRSGVMCGSNTCTQWGWRFFDNQNIEGHDLSVKESNDRNLCQKYCLDDDKCNAYSWIQGDNKCYLKTGVMSEPITNDSGVSYSAVRCGTKRCNSDGWNYFDFQNIMGKDLKTIANVGHRNSCQGHCRETDGCNGYTWINGVCYLKKDVDYYPYTNPSGVAYSARFCGSPTCDFKTENNLGNMKSVESKEKCEEKCRSVESCTHWTWTSDGTCYLKYGLVSNSDKKGAGPGTRCGIIEEKANRIQWHDSYWTHGCRLDGGSELENTYARNPENCISQCLNKQSCTHFNWFLGNEERRCILKGGSVSKEQANLVSPTENFACGILPNIPPVTNDRIRGVNLGGWLVAEPWITPSLFEKYDVEDEYSLGVKIGTEKAYEHLKAHWETFYSESDFKDIADWGLNLVRIPVGYWSFSSKPAPFVAGAVPYLDKAIVWARKYGLQVLIDLHGTEGSQNGHDNSGHKGPTNWSPYEPSTPEIIDKISARYAKDRDVVAGIQAVNEPRTNPLGTAHYYAEAYKAVRKYSQDITFWAHDNFDIGSWEGKLSTPKYNNVIMDAHHYQVFSEGYAKFSSECHYQEVCQKGVRFKEYQDRNLPIVVGEWSAAMTDCTKYLNGYKNSKTFSSQSACANAVIPIANWSEERKTATKIYILMSLDAFEKGRGWIFWTYKTEVVSGSDSAWDFKMLAKHGLFPKFTKDYVNANYCAFYPGGLKC
ncbi:glycoside hydrolase superfamily [Globomyces pollinis-pini]|nr:glycoside hydrolase superfamily [Globomyces pollinis-pini]